MASRLIRKLDLRAPEVIAAEQAANLAWTRYWNSIVYGVNWHPAKVSITPSTTRILLKRYGA